MFTFEFKRQSVQNYVLKAAINICEQIQCTVYRGVGILMGRKTEICPFTIWKLIMIIDDIHSTKLKLSEVTCPTHGSF